MTVDRKYATAPHRAASDNRHNYRYDGSAVRVPETWEEAAPKKSRSKRRRRKPATHGMKVREAGKVAPFAVLGLLFVGFMVMVTLAQYATLMQVSNEASALRYEMANLKNEEAKLTAQYELAYDLQAIEQEMLSSGEMVKAQSSQIDTITLARPDGAQYYQRGSFGAGLVEGIKGIVSAIGSYF